MAMRHQGLLCLTPGRRQGFTDRWDSPWGAVSLAAVSHKTRLDDQCLEESVARKLSSGKRKVRGHL